MKKLPDIKKEFAEWYQEIIYQAELVDHAPVRGTMVIRPYGYALWEHIKNRLDQRIRETGHHNASFPLFIPQSFIAKEAEHIEGFAPELAIVTHAGGKQLEEPLVVRPTSETIIHYMFARWITSWRDLPLKINQWANVVRWELRPRAFLRTTEFFWQEGHTAHQTKQEAEQEVALMLEEYVALAHEYLAIPVIAGRKSEAEKFPGAEKTLTFEAVMPDGKALQMGTSHLLSQSFAKAFDMSFQDQDGVTSYPYLTSWGVTTRLVGATIMMHGDQKGLILPPRIAPIQVVIIPILLKNKDNQEVIRTAHELSARLAEHDIRVHVDDQAHKTPGAKYYHWELRGVPLRVELGPRDLRQQQAIVVDRLEGNKNTVPLDNFVDYIPSTLKLFQQRLFDRAQKKLRALHKEGEKLEIFGPDVEQNGGLYQTGWCLDPVCEQKLKAYKASTRCILEEKKAKVCFNCDKASQSDVLVAKSY